MSFPASPYIDQIDGPWGIGLRIADTRVSLQLVVVSHQCGQTPDQILYSFPTLTLAKIYGAIAYYLENQQMLDEYFEEVNRDFERRVAQLDEARRARQEALSRQT